MATKGRTPKPAAMRVNRNQPVHEWRDYPNVPNTNGPKIPRKWPRNTQIWFGIVRRMPHTVDWGPDDWAYAMETATVHMLFYETGRVQYATELRRRTAQMGMGFDSRRNLRIRYYDPNTNQGPFETQEEEDEAQVIDLNAYRKIL